LIARSVRGRARGVGTGAVALGVCLLACGEPHRLHDRSQEPVDADVAALPIDSGREVELDPGAGVGVSVEYLGGGLWEITTACDTATSDVVCRFDVLASIDPGAPGATTMTDATGVDLESDDEVDASDPFSLELLFVTSDDLDGVTFMTAPGATVRVSALLYDPGGDPRFDWVNDPRLIDWVGSGVLQQGAPSNPVDLVPDQP
jgi:hypothetical protein